MKRSPGRSLDVSGTGVEKIADQKTAQALLDKTMAMNKTIGWQAPALVAMLALLPQLLSK